MKSFNENEKFYVDEKALWSAFQKRLKKQGLHEKTCSKNDNTMILYFEVEDTGCGMNFDFLIKLQEIETLISFICLL